MNPAHGPFVPSTVALFPALPSSRAPAVPLVPGVQTQRPELGEPVVPALLSPFELRHAGSGALRLQGAVGLALTTLPG